VPWPRMKGNSWSSLVRGHAEAQVWTDSASQDPPGFAPLTVLFEARNSSSPATVTGSPFFRELATFSASALTAETLRGRCLPSCQSIRDSRRQDYE
jgi:hypothetical protein